MRVLCVSDQVDPLVYSPRLKERFGDVDLVLAAGDLPMEYLGFIASMLNKPLLYVEGNHDLGRLALGGGAQARFDDPRGYADSFGSTDIGFRIAREEGLIILGLPGSMRYNGGPNQFSEAGMALRLLVLAPQLLWNRLVHGRACDIVLCHAPPRGVHDRDDPCHRGFRSFRWLIAAARPRWLIHGHVHLYDLADVRVSAVRDTTVVNAFGHWLLDTGEDR